MKTNNLRQTKGITLIALIVTVIILLMLAGVSISAISGEGLFSRASGAASKYEIAAQQEAISLAMYDYTIANLERNSGYMGGNLSSSDMQDLANYYDSIGYEHVYLQSAEMGAVQTDGGTTWIALHLKKKASDAIEFVITRTGRILDTSEGEIEKTILVADTNNANGGSNSTVYTITYNANGGTGIMAPTTGTNPQIASCRFTPPSGFYFVGWNTSPDGNGTDYHSGQAVSSNLNLYAFWINYGYAEPEHPDPQIKESCTLRYDANGGTGTINGQTVSSGCIVTIEGSGQSLTPPSSTKKFDSWNTKADGTGTKYHGNYYDYSINIGTLGESIVLNEDITLYAQWVDKKICTISYSLEPSSETIADKQVYEGENITVQGPTVTSFTEGTCTYSFSGYYNPSQWNLIVPGTQITVYNSMNFDAEWDQSYQDQIVDDPVFIDPNP